MLNKTQQVEKVLKSRKGFTIIELVVVLCILAILALLVIPRVNGFKDQARIAADNEAIHTMNRAISLMCASQNLDTIVGQTSINITTPIANGATVTTMLQFLKDKGMLEPSAQMWFTLGHTYSSVDNKVN